jgi:N-acetylglucosaminyl-diphospho-decaprenol L-rhamnosyltransferase
MTSRATPLHSTQPSDAELTVIIVSFNTRDLTLKAVETLLENAGDVAMRVVVFDNASADGSAEAVATAFPEIEVIANDENLGFAAANNIVAAKSQTEWLLLLNPDTETHPQAVENLLAFSRANPQAGITGGRTVFANGSLNPSSCWQTMTVWSLFCRAIGLSAAFPNSRLFNPEAIGGWRRDSVRAVDIVVGCFLMIPTRLWHELGGFRSHYFMYVEEADLCLRAAKRGYRPMITPDAQIMHLAGASAGERADQSVAVSKAKATLIRDHWSALLAPVGLFLMWLAALVRRVGAPLVADEQRR